MSYLFAAYAATWILIFLYIMSLRKRQKELGEELASLRKMAERKS
jgi:CcmD family protein